MQKKRCGLWKRRGGAASAVTGDIGENRRARRSSRAARSRSLGKLDILVNNAAYQMSIKSIQEVTEEMLMHTYRTNIFAMFFLCKAALAQMQSGSTIINTKLPQSRPINPPPLFYPIAPRREPF